MPAVALLSELLSYPVHRRVENTKPFDVCLRNAVAPTATGSKTIGFLLTFAALPATNMPSLSLIVLREQVRSETPFLRHGQQAHPKLMSRPEIALLRSPTSCSAEAMMGEPPMASVALAESLATTIFVIYGKVRSDGIGNQAVRRYVPDEPMGSNHGRLQSSSQQLSTSHLHFFSHKLVDQCRHMQRPHIVLLDLCAHGGMTPAQIATCVRRFLDRLNRRCRISGRYHLGS